MYIDIDTNTHTNVYRYRYTHKKKTQKTFLIIHGKVRQRKVWERERRRE
jgi:hypothetical protein